MSLAAIWSGNFRQLRNSLGGYRSVKLFRFHTGVNLREVVEARRCNLRPLATKIEGRNEKSQSNKTCNINLNLCDTTTGFETSINKPEPHEFNAIQCFNFQQKISDSKNIDWFATIFVVHIKTSGFSHQHDRIIEFAVCDLIGGKNGAFEMLINPEKDVKNAYLHGISNHMLNRPDVPSLKEFIPNLLEYVRSRQMDGKPVVWIAHNGSRFHAPFIISEFHRCSEGIPERWRFVDSLPLARQVLKPDGSKLPSYSLKALRKHYHIPLVGPANRAMQDVITLWYVLQIITFDLGTTIPELMEKAFRAFRHNNHGKNERHREVTL